MKYPENAVYSIGDKMTLRIIRPGMAYPIELRHKEEGIMKLSEQEGYELMQSFQHYFGVKTLLRASTPLPSSEKTEAEP